MDLVEIQFKIPHLHAGCVEQRQGHFSATEIGGNLLLLASLQIHVQILLCTVRYVPHTMDYVLYTMDFVLCTICYVLGTLYYVFASIRSWYNMTGLCTELATERNKTWYRSWYV